MIAIFYTFTKRINSTARPGAGTNYDITLKDDTSLLQPEIYLKWTGSGSPGAFNYCYIPDFQRYYWISNWTYTERQWGASLSVDVLASWKAHIGNASKYVLRSASAYDPHVLDTLYPATGESRDLTWTGVYATPADPTVGGSYILSVCGETPNDPDTGSPFTSIAGMGYYVCTPAQMSVIIAKAFNSIKQYVKSDPAQDPVGTIEQVMKWIGNSFIMTAANVTDYINGIMWVPLAPGSIADTGTTVNVMMGLVNVGTAYPLSVTVAQFPIDIPLNGIGAGSDWEWLAPFASYTFEMLPFGVIPLDSVAVLRFKHINAIIKIDMATGLAVLKIYGVVAGAEQYLLAERSAQVGVPIQLAGYTYDFVGALATMAGGAAGAVASLATGDISSAMMSIGNAARAAMPDAIQDGRSGGVAAQETIATIHCRQLYHVPEDIAEQGRPLCEIRTLNTLSGFILCRDGDIQAPATDGELEQISSYLTGGFFYE